ncbi:hypothetical protein CUN67_25730 (plasmid) [Pantoea cypripedii]|uniref:HNH nuclease domain-containing protein n=2 Tax=Pantoea cypripedii TaxID=55209 RepID=A0A6B9G4D9_PANCY|nr:hypothetical protein CUN67_25730 [Pantoea cypripedii]
MLMDLPPIRKGKRIYDLLKEAGMQLHDWPHANDPSRNQRWAWLEGDIAVVNVWVHKLVAPTVPGEPYTTQYTARGQQAKGEQVDGIYQEIIGRNLPVRVILKVKNTYKRALDTEVWSATYDEHTGTLSLVRGGDDQFADQHGEVSFPSGTHESSAAKRNRTLRLLALKRSGGKCEYCGQPGFRTQQGAIFAEVHHIVPLSEGGADEAYNLIVLCPNDHRKAHYGQNIKQLRSEFMGIRRHSSP